MALTPEEIANKQFTVVLRGYEKAEVDAFLSEVAKEITERPAGEAGAGAPAAAPAVTAGPPSFDALGQEVSAVLEAAKSAAENMRSEAQAEAEETRRSAAEVADRLRRQAQEESDAERASAKQSAEQTVADAERAARETREGAERHARETQVDADRYARETRSQAEAEAAELLDNARRKHRLLKAHEKELRDRVTTVEQALATLQGHLREETEIPAEDLAAAAEEPLPAAGAAAPTSWTQPSITEEPVATESVAPESVAPEAEAEPIAEEGRPEEAELSLEEQATEQEEMSTEPAEVAAEAAGPTTERPSTAEGPGLLEVWKARRAAQSEGKPEGTDEQQGERESADI
ncbi:MAG: DivIVA domain-containing protein [Actinomycetota bacterium]